MTTQNFDAKSIIFREGEPTGCAYILDAGKVEILKHGDYGEPVEMLHKTAVQSLAATDILLHEFNESK